MHGGKAECFGFFSSFFVPETLEFFPHAMDECLGRGGPVEFVGIGDEDAEYGVGVESEGGEEFFVLEGFQELAGGGFQVFTEELCHLVEGTESAPGEAQRVLSATAQFSDELDVAHVVVDGVSTGVDVSVVVHLSGEPSEVGTVGDVSGLAQGLDDLVEGGARRDVDVGGAVFGLDVDGGSKGFVEEVVGDEGGWDEEQCEEDEPTSSEFFLDASFHGAGVLVWCFRMWDSRFARVWGV